ncbi:hypothetical protein V501_09592 [Pseudogymnoascus sp. VKM F-4519 (FW-2642)]|nr:hypothetical protein V501_09592 [Pseudogymnoascus sp. VKM F-4519 (FW-2642)]
MPTDVFYTRAKDFELTELQLQSSLINGDWSRLVLPGTNLWECYPRELKQYAGRYIDTDAVENLLKSHVAATWKKTIERALEIAKTIVAANITTREFRDTMKLNDDRSKISYICTKIRSAKTWTMSLQQQYTNVLLLYQIYFVTRGSGGAPSAGAPGGAPLAILPAGWPTGGGGKGGQEGIPGGHGDGVVRGGRGNGGAAGRGAGDRGRGGGGRDQRMKRPLCEHIILRVYEEQDVALGEMFISAMLQAYTVNGGGFSHAAAGTSIESIKRTSDDSWKKFGLAFANDERYLRHISTETTRLTKEAAAVENS